jgi:uncharacterized protein (DUF924 family)
MNEHSIKEIISFWFEEIAPEKHFTGDRDLDFQIKERFLTVYEDIVKGLYDDWKSTSWWWLAQILVLDQFSRNMFRGEKKAFAMDEKALELAQYMVENALDKELPYHMRVFVYMPYMHSESKEVHTQALKIFTEYGNENNLHYEKEHKKIIDRFGRYPHRNTILWRESTPEEQEFLKTHKGF